jgi:hypothetical protein
MCTFTQAYFNRCSLQPQAKLTADPVGILQFEPWLTKLVLAHMHFHRELSKLLAQLHLHHTMLTTV